MDITFKTPEGVFNYRVCAVIIRDEKLLVMRDQRSPYYYLPGGRVKLHETADEAVLREVREELAVEGRILRPLWLNQGFFVEDVSGERFHEICLYYLVDISNTEILLKGHEFTICEGNYSHIFTWMPFNKLASAYLYPKFLKRKIYNLPEQLTLQAEFE